MRFQNDYLTISYSSRECSVSIVWVYGHIPKIDRTLVTVFLFVLILAGRKDQGCQDRDPAQDHFCLCKIEIVGSDRDPTILPICHSL